MSIVSQEPTKAATGNEDEPQRRDPQVFAENCRRCGSSKTRVVSTLRVTRYCRCNNCGLRWKQSPAA